MRRLLKLGFLGLAGYGAKTLWDRYGDNIIDAASAMGRSPAGPDGDGHEPAGQAPGEAVHRDVALADRLVREEHGHLAAAERRFEREAAGSPAFESRHTPS